MTSVTRMTRNVFLAILVLALTGFSIAVAADSQGSVVEQVIQRHELTGRMDPGA